MTAWQGKIQKDLLRFANPGSLLECNQVDHWFEVKWKFRNNKLAAYFAMNDEEILVRFNNVEMSYRSFLAAPQMSDMLGIANMILQTPREEIFVETKASSPDTVENQYPATNLINKSVSELSSDVTNVIFVNADAGAGKTEILKQIVLDQAEKYSLGQTDFLYLYVNAQGRALARLDEALATEIQDLRASNLTYHTVPALTRNGVLIPIIDGFDELLGVLGYEDSFSSLKRFLNELDGEGCVIASARSTYYQQEFLSRANKSVYGLKGIAIKQIDILPWTDDEFYDFVSKKFFKTKDQQLDFDSFKTNMLSAFSSDENRALRSKPFFVAAAANLILKGLKFTDKELIDQLVLGYIEREKGEKLLDRSGRPLLTSDQIRGFLQAISEEMWAAETRSLDLETVKALADLLFEVDKIDADAARVLQERAATMAFFTAGSFHDRVEFEHQLFFSYFLGNTIAAAFSQNRSTLYSLLVRASLPEASSSFAARRLLNKSFDPDLIINQCSEVSQQGSLRPPHLKENAGTIAAEFLKVMNDSSPQIEFANLSFRNISFVGINVSGLRIRNSKFFDVEFKSTDLTGLVLKSCSGNNITMQNVIVDVNKTKLDITGVIPERDVYGISIKDSDKTVQIFKLVDILDVLKSCELPNLQSDDTIKIATDVLDLIEKIFRKFNKSNVFWPTDDGNKQIVNDKNWEDLSNMMIESGVVDRDRNAYQQGRPRFFIRNLFSPEEIMLGQSGNRNAPEPIQKFWSHLRERWPG